MKNLRDEFSENENKKMHIQKKKFSKNGMFKKEFFKK